MIKSSLLPGQIPQGFQAALDQIRAWGLSVHRRSDSWTKLSQRHIPSKNLIQNVSKIFKIDLTLPLI